MNHEVFYPLDEYPIDSLPLDMTKNIRLYLEPSSLFGYVRLKSVLIIGKQIYDSLLDNSSEFKTNAVNSLFFTADTGYTLSNFIPNSNVYKMIKNHPNIAITDLEKALLGCIYLLKIMCDYKTITTAEINLDEFLYGFIYFFYNVQEYELKNHTTVNISKNADYSYILPILLTASLVKPNYFTSKRVLVELSEEEVIRISEAVSYRKEIREAVFSARNTEKEYARKEENIKTWELFISCVNFRIAEEKRVLELINKNVDYNEKISEYTHYLAGLKTIDSSLTDKELSFNELLSRIADRDEKASNYFWIKTSAGEVVPADRKFISIAALPISFNCVLIAYHLFLLNPTKEVLRQLIKYLYVFVCRNLSQIDDLPDTLNSIDKIEDNIIELDVLISNYYYSHKELIDNESLQFDRILQEETLSGFSFEDDIYDQFKKKQQELILNALNTTDNLDSVDVDYISKLLMQSWSGKSKALEEKTQVFFDAYTNQVANAKELIEREKCKRLVVSINAIYILTKTIEMMFDKNLVSEEKKCVIGNIEQKLNDLEYSLVRKTYISPKTCYSVDDEINMRKYRLNKGIDASQIQKRNEKIAQEFLLESTKNAIIELHNEAKELDLEKANEIRNELRKKINNYPECELKTFVIELVDNESNYLCERLIDKSKNTSIFTKYQNSVREYIGPLSDLLPEKTINALATAELLFYQYATPNNATAGFDYSCISVLYYQAVESMYNELVWSGYVNTLNEKNGNGEPFYILYLERRLPSDLFGYLPIGSKNIGFYCTKEGLKTTLPMGTFKELLSNIMRGTKYDLQHFRAYLDEIFGFKNISPTSLIYKDYQERIEEFQKQLESATPKRNAASHGEKPISLDECHNDKKIVLSDIASIRERQLGLILLFLSLYGRRGNDYQ